MRRAGGRPQQQRLGQGLHPGKMFECLATGLPMLVVGPADGDLQALCVTWGVTFVPHDAPDGRDQVDSWLQPLRCTPQIFPCVV